MSVIFHFPSIFALAESENGLDISSSNSHISFKKASEVNSLDVNEKFMAKFGSNERNKRVTRDFLETIQESYRNHPNTNAKIKSDLIDDLIKHINNRLSKFIKLNRRHDHLLDIKELIIPAIRNLVNLDDLFFYQAILFDYHFVNYISNNFPNRNHSKISIYQPLLNDINTANIQFYSAINSVSNLNFLSSKQSCESFNKYLNILLALESNKLGEKFLEFNYSLDEFILSPNNPPLGSSGNFIGGVPLRDNSGTIIGSALYDTLVLVHGDNRFVSEGSIYFLPEGDIRFTSSDYVDVNNIFNPGFYYFEITSGSGIYMGLKGTVVVDATNPTRVVTIYRGY